MNLPPSLKAFDTVKLFNNKYSKKIVITNRYSIYFRAKYLSTVLPTICHPCDTLQLEYAKKIIGCLSHYKDEFDIRVESPRVTVYTNSINLIKDIIDVVDHNDIKKIYLPNPNYPPLNSKEIILKNIDFGYKVHISGNEKPYNEFLNWANTSDKIKLTNSASYQLSKSNKWRSSYFYVKDEKTITMTKLHLGNIITKIEKIIKV
jgi:hypothetical protein